MGVVGGGEDDGVDVFVGEDVLVAGGGFRGRAVLFPDGGGGGLESGAMDVADGGDGEVGLLGFREFAHQVAATASGADEADADEVGGGGLREERGGGEEKSAAGGGHGKPQSSETGLPVII